jgi:beta-galactosidase
MNRISLLARLSRVRAAALCTMALCVAAMAAAMSVCAWAAPGDVWIEGESYDAVAPAAVKPAVEDVGRPDYLSAGKWLHLNVDAANVAAQAPDGVTLTYRFQTDAVAASLNVWDRIGYERVRSPFSWRLDGGAWTRIAPDADTVDVEELQVWNPVAWLPLGTASLAAGAHVLEIRVEPSKDEKGSLKALVYASDCLLLTPRPFHPNGKLQPGDPAALADADRAAAAQAFPVTVPAGAAQTATPLTGDWQITPDDEMVVDDRLGPIRALPSDLDAFAWRAIRVPGDRNAALPEMSYVHRYYLRTRAAVPASLAGRSFILHLPAVNMLATVFVNGQPCGFCDTPFAPFDCDITRAIVPGKSNEIVVGIKDFFYAVASGDGARHPQYLPFTFWHYNAWMQVDMPVLSHYESGILRTPELVVAGGPAYTTDVFARPSVRDHSLGLDVTLHNPGAAPVSVRVENDVAPLLAAAPAPAPSLTFAPRDVTVPAGQDAVVHLAAAWPDPHLWWPDDPYQYSVVTRIVANGATVDERRTKFGFREIGWQGANFTLNGVPWHLRGDTVDPGPGEAGVAVLKRRGQDMVRLWSEAGDPDTALDLYDRTGILVRRTGIFDGEGSDGLYDITRPALWANYRRQLAAWIRGQRNHPSLFLWSVENEITFINGHVFGNDAITTAEHHHTADVVASVDPTRPFMVDGGNALLDESFPVYGGHYMEPALDTLPGGAYDRAAFAHRQVWPVTQVKPIVLGEAYYADGFEPQEFATVGGEAAFAGKADAAPAIGLVGRMLSEGYRWNDVNFQLWYSGPAGKYWVNSWQPVAALIREWDSAFGSQQGIARTIRIFNDTHDASPITLSYALAFDGRTVVSSTSVHHIPPGRSERFTIWPQMPSTLRRLHGTLTLTLLRGGQQVFRADHAISVLPAAADNGFPVPPAPAVALYDPAHLITQELHREHMPYTLLSSLSALPTGARLLIVGPDALDERTSASSQLAAFAAAGRTVIVLEQRHPLRYQGIPGQMETDTGAASGQIAFPEDPDSPALTGIEAGDLLAWGPDGAVYRTPYRKPESGGRSLVECGTRLSDTALVAFPAGRGLLLLSQLDIGEKLGTCAPARALLYNLMRYGLAYRPITRPVTAVVAADSPLAHAMDAVHVLYAHAADPLAAISRPGGVAVIDATPENLAALADAPARVAAFTGVGGWIFLNGLTPDGLASYNRLVGIDHLIRKFGREKVQFPAIRPPLIAGLPQSAVVMGSGQQIFNYQAGQFPAEDAYSYVVDYDDIAPFCKSPFFAWSNIVNNFTQNDGYWPLIINLPVPADGSPYTIPITLPRPERLTQFTWVSDTNYEGTTGVSLILDGKEKLSFATKPNGDFQAFPLQPARAVRKDLTLQVDSWEDNPTKLADGKVLIGIDNIYLKAYRTPDFYARVKPLLNIGAMMEYPRGTGGIVLCNVAFKDVEANPENLDKKRTILSTLLHNVDAAFSTGRAVIAGSALTYTPVDISKQANQFTTDRGWFGDAQHTFAALPGGRQTLAGIPYDIYAFRTSPVPTAILLGGPGIPGNLPDHVMGIPVNRTADALFFLQAARIDIRRSPDEIQHGKRYEMADYIVHYADGATATVPIYSEIDVDDYKQEAPVRSIPGAQVAWTAPYSNVGAGKAVSAVAYSMQWNNPRPEEPIASVDMVYGPDRRGVPALLAITAASAGR